LRHLSLPDDRKREEDVLIIAAAAAAAPVAFLPFNVYEPNR
jgi:UDP-N-acetylmuramyl pentapeptide phosphotransferase/UDP-N-acetylglucosamine-1-phosphate transferase